MMADYTFTVDGTDVCDEFGARLLDFSEELPEPKVIKVSIPAGLDLDITDAFGAIGYTNGKHDLSLLVRGADEPQRMERVRSLIAFLHGKMMDYALSWDTGYSYRGRFAVRVERVVDYASRVTVSIDRRPYKTKAERVTFEAAPSHTHVLTGSARYQDLRITLAQAGTVRFDGGTVQQVEAGTELIASDVLGYSHDVYVRLTDWLMYLDHRNENYVINAVSHRVVVSGGDLSISNAPYMISDGDMVFSGAESQKAVLDYYRWDL